MKKRTAQALTRIVVIILVMAFLPIDALAEGAAAVRLSAPQEAPLWENSIISGDVALTQDTVVRGEVTIADGGMITVENCRLSIAPDAVLRGSVSIGRNGTLDIGGTLDGDAQTRDRTGSICVRANARVDGTLTIGCDGERTLEYSWTVLETEAGSKVRTLVLDGCGEVSLKGDIELIEATTGNKTHVVMESGRVGTMYARSDARYDFFGDIQIGQLIMDCEDRRKTQHVGNVCLNELISVETAEVYAGFLDVHNGAQVGTVRMYGDNTSCHVFSFGDRRCGRCSRVDEIYVYGRRSWLAIEDQAGYVYMQNGDLCNYGQIGTLVFDGSYAETWIDGKFDDRAFPYPEGYFSSSCDTMIVLGGDVALKDEAVIGRMLTLGGLFSQRSVAEMREGITARNWQDGKAKALTEGGIQARSGERYTAACDAYTALTLTASADGDGGVLILAPGDQYHWLELADGEQSVTLMAKEAGEFTLLPLGGAQQFTLNAALEEPVRIDCTLTARSAAAKGDKAEKTALQMAGADYALYNETAGGRQIDCFLDGETILALPQEAAQGDTLRLCVEGAEDTLLTLDGQRHARAAVEQVEPGRYEGMPTDETRAHLYLYDETGAFMKEVFYSGGSYSTGALEAGRYQALWIRAGVGGWKLPQLADFEQNGLREGEHYLLEQLIIEPGVIARSKPDIPEEPALQSPWLDAAGTGYQAAVGTIVEDALAMMSLSWRISDPEAGRATAKIDFLPGSRYVEGSAAIDGQAVDARWDGQTLYVPLEAQEGKLLFYMKGTSGAQSITSSAAIVFEEQGGLAQYVGSAQTRIAPLSLTGPALTDSYAVKLHGYSSPYSTVTIEDNGQRAGIAVTDGVGFFSATVPLSREAEHAMTVRSDDGEAVSEAHTVRVASGAPRLRLFTLDYIEHGQSKRIELTGEQFGRSTIRFAYEPGKPMSFTLEYENDELVESMTLVAAKNGHREELKLTAQGDGVWTAEACFDEGDMFVPDEFIVEYTFRADALAEAFSRSSASVPLLRVLEEAQDIGGDVPLTRYTLAEPALQEADTGFGPGWLTQYHTYAHLEQEGETQLLTVWSPEATRWFAGENGKLEEIGGYATARISKGAATVTEADGGELAFTAEGRLAQMKDSYGRTLTPVFDGNGRLSAVRAKGAELTLTYGADGHITKAECGEETAEYTYDSGYLTRVRTGDGDSVSYAYDGLHTATGIHPLTGVNAGRESRSYRYDELGRVVSLTSEGETTQIEYGESTLTLRTAEASAVITMNEAGGIERVDASDGSTIVVDRSEIGTVLTVTDAFGARTLYALNGQGALIATQNAAGGSVFYEHDEAGHISAVTDEIGSRTQYAYDKHGNVTSITYADGTSEAWAYDESGRLIQRISRAGEKTRLSYDKNGNLSRIVYADGKQVSLNSNEEGTEWNLDCGEEHLYFRQESDWSHSHSSTGDAGANWGEEWMSLHVDGMGAGTQLSQGRVQRVETFEGQTLTACSYDLKGRLKQETLGNGATVNYSYEGDRLTGIENRAADGTLLSFYRMGYDERGLLTRYETAEGVWLYEYDVMEQLTRTTAPDGTVTETVYDAAGNRIREITDGQTTEYTVNALGQYTQIGETTLTYDANGRLTGTEGPEGTASYEWDVRGALTAVERNGQRIEYTYDLMGSRASRTENGVTTLYDTVQGELPTMLRETTGESRTVYYYGAAGLVAACVDGAMRYYTFTPGGSVSEVLDENGAVLEHYVYDPQGRVLSGAHATLTYGGRFGITDEGDGLYCARARSYDADLGRFLSPDPAGQQYDINLYRYAGNNPVMNGDITGKAEFRYGTWVRGTEHMSLGGQIAMGLLGIGAIAWGISWLSISSGAILLIVGGISTLIIAISNPGYGAELPEVLPIPDNIHPDSDSPEGPFIADSSPTDAAVDPSGYVCEAVASNRIEGVTARVYFRGEDGSAVLFDAEAYGQTNPQQTDFLGQYGWYVPEGEWKVVFEKEGYETLETSWLPVPPPQTEVNVAMVSTQAPEVSHAALYAEGAEISFTRYMDIESVCGAITATAADGRSIAVQTSALNAEALVSGEGEAASRFLVSAAEGLAEGTRITIDGTARSIAGLPVQRIMLEPQRIYRLESLGLEAEYTLDADAEVEIRLQATGEGGFETLELDAALSGDCAQIEALTGFDAQGTASLRLRTAGEGTATLRLTETSNGLEAVALIRVAAAPDYLYEASINTNGDAGVRLWTSPERKKSVGCAAKGEIVQVLAEEDGLARVRCGELEGYTEIRYLKPTGE